MLGRTSIIFSDAQKNRRTYTYTTIKYYMINRLLQTDIKSTTALNTLSSDIFMRPEENLDAFWFRIREIVREGIPYTKTRIV